MVGIRLSLIVAVIFTVTLGFSSYAFADHKYHHKIKDCNTKVVLLKVAGGPVW